MTYYVITVKRRISDHLIRDHLRTGPTKFRHFTPGDNTITVSIKCSDQLIMGEFAILTNLRWSDIRSFTVSCTTSYLCVQICMLTHTLL